MTEFEEIEPKKKAEREVKVEKTFISIDTSDEELLRLNDSGKEIYFRDGVKTFKRLKPDVLQKLSHENSQKYYLALGIYQGTLDLSASALGLKKRPGMATATARLKVEGQVPGFHYAWKRADEFESALADGYVTVTDQSVRTFHESGSSKKVSMGGVDELVLMCRPETMHQEHLKAVEEKSKRRCNAVEVTAAKDIARDGVIPVIEEV